MAKHFVVEFKPAVDPAKWFFLVRGLEDALMQEGYDFGEWNDETEFDRKQILEGENHNIFEGFIHNKDESIDREEIENITRQYLKKHDMELERLVLE